MMTKSKNQKGCRVGICLFSEIGLIDERVEIYFSTEMWFCEKVILGLTKIRQMIAVFEIGDCRKMYDCEKFNIL